MTNCKNCERSERDSFTAEELAKVASYEEQTSYGILEIQRLDDKVVPTLINGKPVDRADWLEVVRIGNRSCTATLVGKNCAITAAHCGRNGSRSNVEIYNGPNIAATVVQMPQYSNGSNYDLAILVLDDDVDIDGLNFATVGFDHLFWTGQDVDLCGYGCIRPGGGGGNDGVLRFGESKVTGSTGTDVVTQWRPGGAALCFGDSGGPMFKDGSNLGGNRTIIAVNSKGNIRDTNYNMKLNLKSVKDWLTGAAAKYNLEIYGLNAGPTDPPPPPPPPEPGEDRFTATDMIQYCDDQIELHSVLKEKLSEPTPEPGDPNDGGNGNCDGNTFGL